MANFRDTELVGLTLRTARLDLRPWRQQDAQACFEAMQDLRMRHFLKVPDPYTSEDAQYWVTTAAPAAAQNGTGMELAVVARDSGTLVGSAALRLPADDEAPATIGYWIAPGAQGERYAAEISAALADWGFAHGISRVEIHCEVTNLASAHTALRAGFAFEAFRRKALKARGELRDAAVFVRLAGSPGTPIPPVYQPFPANGVSDGEVRLRVIAPSDAEAMTEMERDDTTVAVGFTGSLPTLADHQERCDRAALGWLVGPALAQLAVVDEATGRFAGSIQLRLAGPPHIGGIGYGVHPAFRGRGFTARALRLLTEWAFAEGGFARLELGAKQSNIASQRAAASGGFDPDGVRRARLMNPDGSYSDEVRFALVAPHLR